MERLATFFRGKQDAEPSATGVFEAYIDATGMAEAVVVQGTVLITWMRRVDLLVVVAIALYFVTERRTVLHKREYEKLFWLFIGVYAGARTAGALQLTLPMTVAFALLVAETFNLLASYVTSQVTSLKMLSDGLWALRKQEARRCLKELSSQSGFVRGRTFHLKDLVDKLYGTKAAGLKMVLFGVLKLHTPQQEQIHSILKTSPAKELNYHLSMINCSKLAYVAERGTFSMLLGEGGRIKELSLVSKVLLLDGLQRIGIVSSNSKQLWARNLVLSFHGKELEVMKAILDSRGDWHSLHKLVFYDLRGVAQQEVMRHLHSEGLKRKDEQTFMGNVPMTKVISDVDDTLLCSGGRWPAGVDARLPKRVMYPGCCFLFQQIAAANSPKHNEFSQFFSSASLVLLTARPKSYKGMSEIYSYKMLTGPLKRKGLLRMEPVVLCGDLKSGLHTGLKSLLAVLMDRFKTRNAARAVWSPIALKKAEAVKQFMMLYAECQLVLFGDSGQGDLELMKVLSDESGGQAGIRASFIHKVPSTSTSTNMGTRKIFPYKTYIGAATLCYKDGILCLKDTVRVAAEVVNDLEFLAGSVGPEIKTLMKVYLGDVRNDLSSLQRYCKGDELNLLQMLQKRVEVLAECGDVRVEHTQPGRGKLMSFGRRWRNKIKYRLSKR